MGDVLGSSTRLQVNQGKGPAILDFDIDLGQVIVVECEICGVTG